MKSSQWLRHEFLKYFLWLSHHVFIRRKMLVCPVRTPQFLTYDSLGSESSCQALLLVLYGVQHAKHTVHMLCGQNQSAMESHDATWASPTRSNRNLLSIWFRIKLGHWTFGNLSLLPNFSQPPHSGLWSGNSRPKRLSFKSSVCYFSHLFQRKCVSRVALLYCCRGKRQGKQVTYVQHWCKISGIMTINALLNIQMLD